MMSYSRWGSSYWYTFWCSHDGGAAEDRNNALFEVCGVGTFTAEQIREDIDSCVAIAEENCKKCTTKPSPEDMKELREYMLEFVSDIDEQYAAATQ